MLDGLKLTMWLAVPKEDKVKVYGSVAIELIVAASTPLFRANAKETTTKSVIGRTFVSVTFIDESLPTFANTEDGKVTVNWWIQTVLVSSLAVETTP